MQIERPLFWNQGTLLQPQHFQLLERISQGLLAPYQKYLEPHFLGGGFHDSPEERPGDAGIQAPGG